MVLFKLVYLISFTFLLLTVSLDFNPNIYINVVKTVPERRDFIRDRFRENWYKFIDNYKGADEINPITGEPKTPWGGWEFTLVDSLDTLFIMELNQEFEDATEKVSKIDFTKGNFTTSFLQVVKRSLGGLISAYDLSEKPIFLSKAIDLANLIIRNFNSPSGYPYTNFNFETRQPELSKNVTLANIGTCQLEFARLSIITGNQKYRNITFRIYDKLNAIKKEEGVYTSNLNIDTGLFIDENFSWGASSDSFYEYLLKVPLLIGTQDPQAHKFLEMFRNSTKALEDLLLRDCDTDKLCLGHTDGEGRYQNTTHHLEFFVPGLLILGGLKLEDGRLIYLGRRLLDTFRAIPQITATGLVPEAISFNNGEPIQIDHAYNKLRPELAESIFYAHRFDHRSEYQYDAWTLFRAFDMYSRVEHGFAEYEDVNNKDRDSMATNNMQSHFYSETLKYLYLILSPKTVLPLEKWVFNTGGHPFLISSS